MSIDNWPAKLRIGAMRCAQPGGRYYGRGGGRKIAAVLTAARGALGQSIPLDMVLVTTGFLIMAMS